MDKETKQILMDYFEPCNFADYVGVSVEDMIDAFPEKLDDDTVDELLEIASGR